MDEARKVLERLERIEGLRREAAPAWELIGELRGLLEESEACLAADPDGTQRVRAALDGRRSPLDGAGEVVAAAGS